MDIHEFALGDQGEALLRLRHSTEHVLMQAMERKVPGILKAMGPATGSGFYFDFFLPEGVSFSALDLPEIEAEMRKIAALDLPIVREEISVVEARKLFAGNPYKQEWLDEIEKRGESASLYWTGEPRETGSFFDLCAGPHVSRTGEIGAFRLLSVAGAHWRGRSDAQMLVRIHGTAFANETELEAELERRAEAEKRDHRRLGKKLELFHFDPTAPGMPYWLPRGLKILRELLRYWGEEHEKEGYQEISSPLVNHRRLWEISGHWEHFRENMFLIPIRGADGKEELHGLKPMNCPNAMVVFNLRKRSYAELPLRLSDCDVLHRYEPSGSLHGLLRVRHIQQDDAHIFLSEEQVKEEFERIFVMVERFYGVFGLKHRFRLSTRPEGFLGELAAWERAEGELRDILDARLGPGNYVVAEGDGAFYGPKIDILMEDALGRPWQMGTIQLDLQLPARFGCRYVGRDGKERVPWVIHRVIYGALERFIGILIENFAGAFPLWLAPEQIRVLPVAEQDLPRAGEVLARLRAAGFRAELDSSGDRLAAKILRVEHWKVPVGVIVGSREAVSGLVSVRERGGKKREGCAVAELIDELRGRAERREL